MFPKRFGPERREHVENSGTISFPLHLSMKTKTTFLANTKAKIYCFSVDSASNAFLGLKGKRNNPIYFIRAGTENLGKALRIHDKKY